MWCLLCCRGLKDQQEDTLKGWKPESSGDESSLREDFTGVLPEASGKDNTPPPEDQRIIHISDISVVSALSVFQLVFLMWFNHTGT